MTVSFSIADRARAAGKTIHLAAVTDSAHAFNAGIAEVLKFPFSISPGRLIDIAGKTTERFACVVHIEKNVAALSEDISADNACAVVDLVEEMGIEELRSAHARVLTAKRLEKSPTPNLIGKTPVATVTMAIIYARLAKIPIPVIAEELQRLNEGLEHYEWIDMVAVSNVSVISYGCQFAGDSSIGGLLPPSRFAKDNYSPPWYIIPTMQATREGTFNKVLAFIISYTAFFSPGVSIPNFNDILTSVCKNVCTLPAYQYNVRGDLAPVPPEHYAGRLMTPRPFLIEAKGSKELLASLVYLPWQDGGVILSKGKLPLEGLMVFLGKDALKRGGVMNSAPNSQASYVMPITTADFAHMMTRIRNQSNMVVRQHDPKLVMEKLADEGTQTPFVARIFMGLLQLGNTAFPDPKARQDLDNILDQALTPLMGARTTATMIQQAWSEHMGKIASGEGVLMKGGSIEIDGVGYRTLRREVNSFLYDAAKSIKEGSRKIGSYTGKDIGFMFQKQKPYEAGLQALRHSDPTLAAYIEQIRDIWSERLIKARNDLDHGGWVLPRIRYELQGNQVHMKQPEIDGTPVLDFVNHILDRLCCFAEEFIAYCFQSRLPEGIGITQIPILERPVEAPERFRLTLQEGGLPLWQLNYSPQKFEET